MAALEGFSQPQAGALAGAKNLRQAVLGTGSPSDFPDFLRSKQACIDHTSNFRSERFGAINNDPKAQKP